MFFCYRSENSKKSPLQAHIIYIFKSVACCRRIYKTSPSDRGSASVEAAIVLPVFILAVMGIAGIAGAFRTKVIVYEGMHETAAWMAEYAYLDRQVESGADVGDESVLIKNGISAISARTRLDTYIDNEELVDKYVAGGINGIRIVRAGIREDDHVELEIAYDLVIEVPVVDSIEIPCSESIRQRAFVGYSSEHDEDSDAEYVYVAENGDVYHRSRSCYHIRLTIKQVSPRTLDNEYSELTRCRLCAHYSGRGTLYVTDSGDRYHFSLGCPGLKRTIYRVKKSDREDLRPCSNCGG